MACWLNIPAFSPIYSLIFLVLFFALGRRFMWTCNTGPPLLIHMGMATEKHWWEELRKETEAGWFFSLKRISSTTAARTLLPRLQLSMSYFSPVAVMAQDWQGLCVVLLLIFPIPRLVFPTPSFFFLSLHTIWAFLFLKPLYLSHLVTVLFLEKILSSSSVFSVF